MSIFWKSIDALCCYIGKLQIIKNTSAKKYRETDTLHCYILQLEEDFIAHTLEHTIYDIYLHEKLYGRLVLLM